MQNYEIASKRKLDSAISLSLLADGVSRDQSAAPIAEKVSAPQYIESEFGNVLGNNFKSSANYLGTQRSTFTYKGNIPDAMDIDWFYFVAGKSGTITVSISNPRTEVGYNSSYDGATTANLYHDMKINVAAGKKYYFAVSNYKLNQTPGSYTVTVSFGKPAPPPDTTPPTIPGNLSQTVKSDDVVLNWGDSSDNIAVTGYQMRYGTSSYLNNAGVYNATTSALNIYNLDDGTYYWQVRAYDAAKNYSAWAAVKSFTINTKKHDLTPCQPYGWSGAIVVSTVENTTSDSTTFTSDDYIYIDFAIKNIGNATSAYIHTNIYIDGDPAGKSFKNSPLTAGNYTYWKDVNIGKLSAGIHTISIRTGNYYSSDPAELSTTNNTYEKTIYVIAPAAKPDLLFTSFSVSANTIEESQSVVLSFAIKNNNSGNASSSYACIYDGDKKIGQVSIKALSANEYVFDDFTVSNLSVGTHSLRMVVDGGNSVAESNENNNTVTRTVTVVHDASKTAKSDFNGNGKSDLLFVNRQNGEMWIWSDTDAFNASYLGTRNFASDRVSAVGDFNGDGCDDILWQCGSGGVTGYWNGADETQWKPIGACAPGVAVIAGTGDFNSNTMDDIVWRCADGIIGLWLDNSTLWRVLGQVDASWEITGIADFDGVGGSDILWHNKITGALGIWQDGDVRKWIDLGVQPQGWDIVGSGDFTGTGKDEILWHNAASGEVGSWTVTPGQIPGWKVFGFGGLAWSINAVGDTDGNGKDDIIWRNNSTGEIGAWVDGDSTRWRLSGATTKEYKPFHSALA